MQIANDCIGGIKILPKSLPSIVGPKNTIITLPYQFNPIWVSELYFEGTIMIFEAANGQNPSFGTMYHRGHFSLSYQIIEVELIIWSGYLLKAVTNEGISAVHLLLHELGSTVINGTKSVVMNNAGQVIIKTIAKHPQHKLPATSIAASLEIWHWHCLKQWTMKGQARFLPTQCRVLFKFREFNIIKAEERVFQVMPALLSFCLIEWRLRCWWSLGTSRYRSSKNFTHYKQINIKFGQSTLNRKRGAIQTDSEDPIGINARKFKESVKKSFFHSNFIYAIKNQIKLTCGH